jgi:cyclohexanone monooxygenase
VDTDYYANVQPDDNVTLVDLRATPIEAITAAVLRTAAQEYTFDSLVFAIGFDAMTGALLSIRHPRARRARAARQVGGRPADVSGPDRGGFPNLFMITGTGSPSVLSNMIGRSSSTSTGSPTA